MPHLATSRTLAARTTLALFALAGSGVVAQAYADSVRVAKPAEVKALYPVLTKPRLGTDAVPASISAVISGPKPKATHWRRMLGSKPIAKGGITGFWVGPVPTGYCTGYRTTEGKAFATCATVSIRTPSEPQVPTMSVFGQDEIDDATAPVGGKRGRERFVVMFPKGVTGVRVTERGERETRPLTVTRSAASAQVVKPWCLKYKIAGAEKTQGVGCGIVEPTS